MSLDSALQTAAWIEREYQDLAGRTRAEHAAVVLAAEVTRLREQVAHLERLALRSRSAGAGR